MLEHCQPMADKIVSYSEQNFCKLIATVKENVSDLIQRRLKELNIKKSELARRTGFSRTYITDLANGTGNTQSGQYNLPPETVNKLAKALEIADTEILSAMNYLPGKSSAIRKPTNPAEFFEILDEMGLEINLDGGLKTVASLDEDDLQDLLDSIVATAQAKAKRKDKKAGG